MGRPSHGIKSVDSIGVVGERRVLAQLDPLSASAWGPEMDSLVAKPQEQLTSWVSSIANAFNI